MTPIKTDLILECIRVIVGQSSNATYGLGTIYSTAALWFQLALKNQHSFYRLDLEYKQPWQSRLDTTLLTLENTLATTLESFSRLQRPVLRSHAL